jgi:hypothetical protein
MRKSTRFLLVGSLLSIFAASSLSALAEDHKKSVPKAPAAQLKADKGVKDKGGIKGAGKGFAGDGKGGEAAGGAVGGTVGDAVGGTVGGAVGSAIGGILGAFGPK